MRFRTRTQLAFNRLIRRYKIGSVRGLYRVCALIRLESRQSLRIRRRPSRPGSPPSAHTRAGLREINFHVRGSTGIVGPRKFRTSNFFNRPVPNIHEKGGIAIAAGFRRRLVSRYPERSFMWAAVKRLQKRRKISREFNVTLQRSW